MSDPKPVIKIPGLTTEQQAHLHALLTPQAIDMNTVVGPSPQTLQRSETYMLKEQSRPVTDVPEEPRRPVTDDVSQEPSQPVTDVPKRKKASYIGAPAVFALELACVDLNNAFGGFGCFLVGSALERPDWRDVDVRLIMSDEEFAVLFPSIEPKNCQWEFDTRWLLMTVSISEHLSKITGLPVDFQFQPQTFANAWHKGPRNAMGIRIKQNTGAD